MRRILTFACLIALLTGAAAAAETVEREFQVRSGGLLEFDLEAGGTIKITGWGRETVTVAARIGGDDADIVELTVEETNGGVLIATDYRENRGSTPVAGTSSATSSNKLQDRLRTWTPSSFHQMPGSTAQASIPKCLAPEARRRLT